jgi:hypothetical protein
VPPGTGRVGTQALSRPRQIQTLVNTAQVNAGLVLAAGLGILAVSALAG